VHTRYRVSIRDFLQSEFENGTAGSFSLSRWH
jgi:hypothetical protein